MTLPALSLHGNLVITKIPFRLRVLRALGKLIEEVNPTNGYSYDLRGVVFRGRIRYGDDDPIPMISILEAPIPLDVPQPKADAKKAIGRWELLIQGFVDDDKRNPTDPGHHLMAEVKSIIVKNKLALNGTNMLNLGGRVFEMYIGQGAVRPPDEASDKAFFWLTLTVNIGEDLEDPYY